MVPGQIEVFPAQLAFGREADPTVAPAVRPLTVEGSAQDDFPGDAVNRQVADHFDTRGVFCLDALALERDDGIIGQSQRDRRRCYRHGGSVQNDLDPGPAEVLVLGLDPPLFDLQLPAHLRYQLPDGEGDAAVCRIDCPFHRCSSLSEPSGTEIAFPACPRQSVGHCTTSLICELSGVTRAVRRPCFYSKSERGEQANRLSQRTHRATGSSEGSQSRRRRQHRARWCECNP